MVIRCTAPRARGQGVGEPCGGFVGEWPNWMRPTVVRRVQHSSRRAPDHQVAPCSSCGALHEIRLEGARKRLAPPGKAA